jgi:hypothetical protein
MLWLGTLGVVVAARIGCRCGARCATGAGRRRQPEGPGVVSILLRGRRLDRLPVAGGQFFQWRFLRRGLWWQAHPYSLSAAPAATCCASRSRTSATTAPAWRACARARAWRSRARTARSRPTPPSRDRLLLSAPASAPRRSSRCCRSCRRGRRHRAAARLDAADLVLRDEVAAEVRRRGGRLLELVGSRDTVRLDAVAFRSLVPDVREREVYLCGPEPLAHRLAGELRRAGVPEPRIHFEAFAF